MLKIIGETNPHSKLTEMLNTSRFTAYYRLEKLDKRKNRTYLWITTQ